MDQESKEVLEDENLKVDRVDEEVEYEDQQGVVKNVNEGGEAVGMGQDKGDEIEELDAEKKIRNQQEEHIVED